MKLMSKNLFSYRNNSEMLLKGDDCHANKYLLEFLQNGNEDYNDILKVDKIDFMPVNRLITNREVEAILSALRDFLPSGKFTSGESIGIFENNLAEYLGVKNVVALSSGTDALIIGMLSLGVGRGDEVILPPNSFSATENAVLSIGAIPIYADVKNDFTICTNSIENLITDKTKLILPVHLYGRFCDMPAIKEVALKSRMISYHGFDVNEKNKKVIEYGYNSKIDNTQALIGNIRLEKLTYNNYRRIKIAERYNNELSNLERIILPTFDNKSVWHLYPVRITEGKRDEIKSKLHELGVETEIYYPYLSHQQELSIAV